MIDAADLCWAIVMVLVTAGLWLAVALTRERG